jgi:hypothetical protein
MKYTSSISAAFAVLLLASCQTQTTSVLVGAGGSSSGRSFGQPQMSGTGGTIAVQHQCSRAGGKTITIRGVPAGLSHINCKHCGQRIVCGGYGRGYTGYPAIGGYGSMPYPGGPYHDPDLHDAWSRRQGVFGYVPQRYPHRPPGFQAYDPARGMSWDGVSATVQLPPSMTGR